MVIVHFRQSKQFLRFLWHTVTQLLKMLVECQQSHAFMIRWTHDSTVRRKTQFFDVPLSHIFLFYIVRQPRHVFDDLKSVSGSSPEMLVVVTATNEPAVNDSHRKIDVIMHVGGSRCSLCGKLFIGCESHPEISWTTGVFYFISLRVWRMPTVLSYYEGILVILWFTSLDVVYSWPLETIKNFIRAVHLTTLSPEYGNDPGTTEKLKTYLNWTNFSEPFCVEFQIVGTKKFTL